jgi:hypothetical protein
MLGRSRNKNLRQNQASAPPVDLKALHAKIGKLTLETVFWKVTRGENHSVAQGSICKKSRQTTGKLEKTITWPSPKSLQWQ